MEESRLRSLRNCLLPIYCLWVLVQGLLLALLGAIKGIIVLVPVAALTVPAWCMAVMTNWPHQVILAFISVAVTRRLGPNLRVLVLLLLPLPLLLLPLALCLGSFLFSAGVGFFWPLGATVAVGSLLPAQQLLEVAVMEPIDLARSCAVEVWRFSTESSVTFLEELRRPYYGEPLDVSPLRLLVAVLLSLLCSVVSTFAVFVLGLLRLPFVVARSLGEWVGALTRCPVKLLCVWLPFWVLGVPMVPVAVLLVFLAVLLGCFTWLGPACGVAGYVSTPTHRSYGWALWCALDHMYSHIYQLDEAAVRLTGLGTASVLPPPAGYASGRPADGAGAAASAPAGAAAAAPAGPSPLDQAWCTFEDLCNAGVQRALLWGWIPRTDLADTEAYLFIGLPAMALLQLLADAAEIPHTWMPGSEGKDAGGESAGVGAAVSGGGAASGVALGAGQAAEGRKEAGGEGELAGRQGRTSGAGDQRSPPSPPSWLVQMSGGGGRVRGRHSRGRSPLWPSSPVLPGAAPSAAPAAAAPPSATPSTAQAAQEEPAPTAEEPAGSSPPAPASPSFSMPGALSSPQPNSTALAAPQLPSSMLSSSHTIHHHPDPHDQSWDAHTVHRRYSMTSDVGSVIVHDDPDGLSIPWRDPTDNTSAISGSASASTSQAAAPGVRIPPGAASALRATAAGRRGSPRDVSGGLGRAASDRSGSVTPLSEPLVGGLTETETETETVGEGQGRRDGKGRGMQGAGPSAGAAADTLEREATLAKGMGELEAVLGEELGAQERRRAAAGVDAPAGQGAGGTEEGARQGQAAQPAAATAAVQPLGLPPRPPSRRPSEPGATQQHHQQQQQGHQTQHPLLPTVSTGASSSSRPPAPAPAALLPLPPLPPQPQTPSLAPRAATEPAAHPPSTNSPSVPQDTPAAPASPFSATAAPYVPSPFAGAAAGTPTSVTPTAAAAAPGTCAVTLAAEQLDPGVAAALLEELAEHVLTADIGFSSAANPVRLHRSLAALQATPGEVAYMMCHTALLGDARVLELVPLAVVEPTRGRAGHRGHTHTLSGGSSQAGAGTAAAAADAAAAGAAGVALPRGAGSVGVGVGERPGTDTGHVRRPRGRWSLSGVAGRPASGPVGSVAREVLADEPGPAGAGAEGGAGGGAAGPGSTAAERGLQYWFFGRRVSRDGGAGGVQQASAGPSSPLMWLASPTLGSAGRGAGVDVPAAGSSPVPSPLPHQRSHHKQHQHSRNPSVASVAYTVCTNLDSEAAQDDLLPQAPSIAHSAAAEGDKQAPAAAAAARAVISMSATLDEAAAMSTESTIAPSGVSSPAAAAAQPASEHPRAAASTLHTVPEQGASPSVSRSDASSSSNVSGTAAGSELPAPPPPPPAPQAPPQPQSSSTGHFWPFSRHRRARSNPMSSLVLHSPGAEGDHATDNDDDLLSASPRSVPGGGNQTPTGAGGGGGGGASGGGATAAGAAGATETGGRRYRWRRRVSEQGDAAAGKEAAASTGGATDAAHNGTAHSRTPTGNAHGHNHTHGGSEAGVFMSGVAAGTWNVPTVTPQRLSELHAFTAAVQSVATALSKKERMKAIMGRLLTKYGTCTSSVCGDGGAAAAPGVARSEVGSEAVA